MTMKTILHDYFMNIQSKFGLMWPICLRKNILKWILDNLH